MEELFQDLPEVVLQKFKENDITLDILSEINNEHLKELFPSSVGLRIKIANVMKNYLNENDQCSKNLDSPSVSTASTITIEPDDILSDGSIVLDGVLDINDIDVQIVDLYPKKITYNDFHLENLLRTAPLGNSILNFYKKFNHLDDKHVNRLNDIIVRHLYDHIIKHRLSVDEYESLAQKITNLFPNEAPTGFYKPGVKRHSNLKGSPFASGSLVHKARNIIKKSGEATVLRKRKQNDSEEDDTKVIKTALDEEVNEDVLWLKLNREPWEMVLEKWNVTYNIRRCQNFETVSEFLKAWPILQHLQSEVLIALDFEKLYSQSVLALYLKWDIFFEKVLAFRKTNLSDEYAKQLVTCLDTIENEDAKFCIQISLLAYLIPPRGRVSTKNKVTWKFSILEASEGLLVYVKNPGDIQDTIKSVQDRAFKHNQQVQPYLLVEGNSLEDPRNFYIIIDTIRYQFNSAKRAFDCLFKVYHVFLAKYPVEANYLWILIQKGVYSINTPFDVVPPYVDRLLYLLEDKHT